MSKPARPKGGPHVNHLVISVRDIARSHHFYTEMLGWERCGILESPMATQPMYFYRAHEDAHHELALIEVQRPADADPQKPWQGLLPETQVGLSHLAIGYNSAEEWQDRLRHLKANGVEFVIRGNHGMTHSAYITDPDGNGIEVLYELPKEVWEGDLNKALSHFDPLPLDGEEAFVDPESPVFPLPGGSGSVG
jgi:catechol 2,3-dioxygenase